MFFLTGAGNFFKNLWTGLTGPDTAGYYTPKDLTKSLPIPAGAITLERSNDEFFGGAIRKVTGEWANHSIISAADDVTIEAESGGVTNDKIQSHMTAKSQLMIFVNNKMTPEQIDGEIGYGQGSVDKPYNYPAIVFNFLVGGDDSSNQSDYCSELAARATLSQGVPSSAKKPELTSPGDQLVYFLSKDGIAAGWILWDTYNILTTDVIKTITEGGN